MGSLEQPVEEDGPCEGRGIDVPEAKLVSDNDFPFKYKAKEGLKVLGWTGGGLMVLP